MEKAIIYVRVSDQKQNFDRQIEELSKYAEFKKYEVLNTFGEKISGTVSGDKRKEFPELLEFVKDNDVDHLLLWELSRLGRNTVDILNNIELFTSLKINVYCHKENIETLDKDKNKNQVVALTLNIMSTISEMERDSIIKRSRSGIRQNVAKGGGGTGIIKAYGYKREKKKLVIDKEEAEVVKEIFQMSLNGFGTHRIANHLNDKNIPTKYNILFKGKEINLKSHRKRGEQFRWRDATVYTILKNSIYHGARNHKGEIFQIEPIISKEDWEKVQNRLKANSNKKDINRKYDNLLKNKVKCGICGRSYYPHKRESGKDNAYKCLSKRYKESCGNISIDIDKLNNAIIPFIYNTVVHNLVKNIEQSADSLAKIISDLEAKIDSNLEKQNRVERNIKNLIDMQLDGLITKNEFSDKIKTLRDDQENFSDEYNKLKDEIDEQKELKVSMLKLNNYKVEDYSVFKHEMNSFIQEIIIREVKKDSDFSSVFTNAQDKLVFVTLKIIHDELYYRFIISQRTDKILVYNPDFTDGGTKGLLEEKTDFMQLKIDYKIYV